MSIAIVAMTNHTAIKPENVELDNECDTNNGNSTHHDVQDGTYEWNTKTQGWILSSFFYGYVFELMIEQ